MVHFVDGLIHSVQLRDKDLVHDIRDTWSNLYKSSIHRKSACGSFTRWTEARAKRERAPATSLTSLEVRKESKPNPKMAQWEDEKVSAV